MLTDHAVTQLEALSVLQAHIEGLLAHFIGLGQLDRPLTDDERLEYDFLGAFFSDLRKTATRFDEVTR